MTKALTCGRAITLVFNRIGSSTASDRNVHPKTICEESMTVAYQADMYLVTLNNHPKYLGQRSFIRKTHTQRQPIDRTTMTTKVAQVASNKTGFKF